jgi:hypothetical protein
MHARAPKAAPFLRVPVLLAMGLVSMGSGMGNPGCGGSSGGPPSPTTFCDSGCAIEGTYALQFEDGSALGDECAALNVALPTDTVLVLDKQVDALPHFTTLGGARLSGHFYGAPTTLGLYGYAPGTPEGKSVSIALEMEVPAPGPETHEEPLVFQGVYTLKTVPSNTPNCSVTRRFTATR